MQLVDEEDDLAGCRFDLLDEGLEPIFELAAKLGAGDQRPEVERDHALVLERGRHVTAGDALGQPFSDGGLANARLTDEDGVVLGAPGQHLDHATDLLVAADDGVEFALACERGQVAGVLVEDLVLALGVGIGNPLAATELRQRLVDGVVADPGVSEDGSGAALAGQQAEEQMFGGDVLVLELLHLREGRIEHLLEVARDEGLLRHPSDLGLLAQFFSERAGNFVGSSLQFLEDRSNDALRLLDQGEQQVLRLDGLLLQTFGQLLGCLESLLRFFREAIHSHVASGLPTPGSAKPRAEAGQPS